jgi:O-antigen/teichoic acid export membrane protein
VTTTLSRSRALLGVIDQLVGSASNYLTAFVAAAVLVPEEFGAFVAAYAVVTVLCAVGRALVGEPLLSQVSDRGLGSAALGSSALGAAVVLGLAGAALCVVGGLVWGGAVGAGLLALAGWVPGALAVDAGRYVLLARAETGRALTVDVVWALGQVAVLAGVAVAGTWSVPAVAAAWGLGALLGLAVVVAVTPEARAGVAAARPGRWFVASRDVAGWFSVTSVLGQAQVYLVLLVAGLALAPAQVGGLRAVQLLVFQPPVTLFAALLVLATPVMARHWVAGDAAGLRRARRVALAATGVLAAVLLLAVPLRDVLLGLLFPRYVDAAALVLPIVLQTALSGAAVPFLAQVRGARRGKALLGLQTVTALATLAGAAIGLALGGVEGLAWGLATSALVATAVAAAAGRRVESAVSAPVAEPVTAEVAA